MTYHKWKRPRSRWWRFKTRLKRKWRFWRVRRTAVDLRELGRLRDVRVIENQEVLTDWYNDQETK